MEVTLECLIYIVSGIYNGRYTIAFCFSIKERANSYNKLLCFELKNQLARGEIRITNWDYHDSYNVGGAVTAMWITMECTRDNINGSSGEASETPWECVFNKVQKSRKHELPKNASSSRGYR